MNTYERARRLTAWTWAAQTLGVTATADRLEGLVDVTAGVAANNLRPALEAVIKTEVRGFLPSPGAVIAASNRIADRKRSNEPRMAGMELSAGAHDRLSEELNPQAWSTDVWRAFSQRLALDPGFKSRAVQANVRRHEWAAEQVENEIGGRKVAGEFRRRLRRQYNLEAFGHFPRPDPLAGGWKPSREVPIEESFSI